VLDSIIVAARDRRVALGLAQQYLADRIGFHRNTIQTCETGRHDPTLHTLRLWAEALDCDLVLVPRTPAPTATAAGIDHVAVERVIAGQAVELTVPERRHVVELLDRRGATAAQIAERLGVSVRTVVRYRQSEAAKVTGVSESAEPSQVSHLRETVAA